MQYDQRMKNRLKRVEGQIRGILRMMEQGEDCRHVVSQLSAARSGIDRAIGLIVGTNLEECLRTQLENGKESAEDLINEAVNLLVKSR